MKGRILRASSLPGFEDFFRLALIPTGHAVFGNSFVLEELPRSLFNASVTLRRHPRFPTVIAY